MEVLMLWRVHPETVNLVPQGKHYWFDSSYFHQIYSTGAAGCGNGLLIRDLTI